MKNLGSKNEMKKLLEWNINIKKKNFSIISTPTLKVSDLAEVKIYMAHCQEIENSTKSNFAAKPSQWKSILLEYNQVQK